MSFFSKLGGLARKVVGYVAPLTSLIPGVGGAIASGIAGAVGTSPKAGPPSMPPVTTAGSAAGGMVQTLPMVRGGGVSGPGIPTPGGLMGQLGQLGGMALKGIGQGMGMLPAGRGAGGPMATKPGRLTGNMIPRGYVERMSPTGVIYLGKQKRRRGISARDISSFYRVNRLVSKIHGRAHRAAPKRGK